MKKILVTGASGRIGKELVKNLGKLFYQEVKLEGLEFYLLQSKNPVCTAINQNGFSKCSVITNPDHQKYDFAIHLAAIADTSYSEKPENKAAVLETNVQLTQRICELSDRVVLVSTDHVTGHTSSESKEYDIPNPCDFYGHTKAEAEKVVMRNGGSVIRVQTMLGIENRMISYILDAINGKPYSPFPTDDEVRPSYFPDFINLARAIYNSSQSGIFHLSCRGEVFTRYELADLFLQFWLERNFPTETSFLSHEKRKSGPRRLVLNTEETEKKFNLKFTDSLEALKNHFRLTVARMQ